MIRLTNELKTQAIDALNEHMLALVSGETKIGSLDADRHYLDLVTATPVGGFASVEVMDVLTFFGIVE